MALARAGFTVDAVCPSGHPIVATSEFHRLHAYHGIVPLASIESAIAAANPDLLIPCDDLATRQLHEIHERARTDNSGTPAIRALIERSLGASQGFGVVYARTAFMEMAQVEGVRVPRTELIRNSEEARSRIAGELAPVVLKSNGSSGGEGVRVVQSTEEAARAFRKLHAPPQIARALKRAIIDQDKTLVWPSILRSRCIVNAQEFVAGHEATSLTACWQGAVLASLHFEVLHKISSSGPATVIRLVENAEMASATQTMARRLGLCGLHGFDFMLEESTGNAYLIEINPRATQVGHLALGPGRDLPAALYAAVSGQIIRPAARLTTKDTIVLFPGGWAQNLESPFLRSAYHDVPWEEPNLVRVGLEKHRQKSRWYSQRKLVQSAQPT